MTRPRTPRAAGAAPEARDAPAKIDLAASVALVTGASGAIGGAIAAALARRGARVVLTGRDRARLAGVAAGFGAASARAAVEPADLADPQALLELARRAVERHGRLDLLIHAAGLFLAGTVEALPEDDFERLLAVNLRAPYRLTRLLLPELRARRGQIVFVNSSAALAPRATIAAYAASKAALRAFADGLRQEVNADGVRVISLFAGRTASRMQEEVRRSEGKSYDPRRMLQPEDVAQALLAALELPPTAELTDLFLRPMRPAD